MAAITVSRPSSQQKHLRSFDVRRDLNAVADLIESCFSQTLDADGRRYLRRMRAAAQGKGFNRWVAMAAGSATLPLTGFVWAEDEKVVGNLSMIPFFSQGQRIYLIANVAVYPEYRQRGIARALTEAALEKSQQRQVHATWLQVRDDNAAALDLYSKMGFTSRARRTTWQANPDLPKGAAPSDVRVAFRRSRHWPHQHVWLNQNYPPALRWHFPLKMKAMQPGPRGWLHRFFNEMDVRHWAVERDDELLGVLTWQASGGQSDRLWLATPPENDDATLETVIPYINREGRLRRSLFLDYPADRARETLSTVGFKPKQTLIWMETKT